MSAVISADGLYRYRLERQVAPFTGTGTVTFVMLNPSTADAEVDDPTIRRCKRFTADWGFDRLVVVNLFALRTTYPGELQARGSWAAEGPENLGYVLDAVRSSGLTVMAWGAHPLARKLPSKARDLCSGLRAYCLGKTKDGSPRHPLYVRADKKLEAWL